jgi:hypothetical protein
MRTPFLVGVLAGAASLAVAAPSGTLGVDRDAPVVPSGTRATVTLRWQTQGTTAAQVRVSVDGGPNLLMADARGGSAAAPWIVAGRTYDFLLFAERDQTTLLDRATVLGVPAGGGQASAYPRVVPAPPGGRGSTQLVWASDGVGVGDGAPDAARPSTATSSSRRPRPGV